MYCCSSDVVVLTETGLDDTFNNSVIFPQNFAVNRRDRSADNSVYQRLGGVLIAIKKDYMVTELDLSQYLDIEICCSKIQLIFSTIIYVVCVYIPPKSQLAIVDRYLDAIRFIDNLMSASDIIYIFGDFNQTKIDWAAGDADCTFLTPVNALNPIGTEIIDTCQSFGLVQLNPVKNHQNRTLDLIFSNNNGESFVTRSFTPLVPEDAYHPSLHLFCNFERTDAYDNVCDSYKFDFKNANYCDICEELNNYDWSPYLSLKIDDLCSEFYRIINTIIFKFVPVVRVKDSAMGSCPWDNETTRYLKIQKNRAFRKWRSSLRDVDYLLYRRKKSLLKTALHNAYLVYINDIQNSIKSRPNKFWQFINSKNKTDGYPGTFTFNGQVVDTPITICNTFASFFQSVYSNVDSIIDQQFFNYLGDSNNSIFSNVVISTEDTHKSLIEMESNFNPGPDGIPSGFLKKCALPLHSILCHMFNLSLSTGVFPSVWKNSFIVPIFKSGRKNKIENYRGICKQSSIPKLFDKLVTQNLYFYCRSLICNNQHGFVKNRSTVTNLLLFTNFVISEVAKGNQVDTVYTDFSKAFDRVDHKVLLFKLGRLGFPISFTQWLSSFLRNRYQYVNFRNHVSQKICVTSGVPQGSHIGPLLFIMFVNDVVKFLPECNILMFADDFKIYASGKEYHNFQSLNMYLQKFYQWCSKNYLLLNVNKCSVISFSRRISPLVYSYSFGSEIVPRVSLVKDLGVLLDINLSFNSHIDYIINKANRSWGMIRRYACEFSDPYVIKSLYMSFVQTLLEYASVVWCPYYNVNINRVEAVQKRFLRFALRGLPWSDVNTLPSYQSRLKLINMESLEVRRMVAKVVFVHKVLTSHIDSPEILNLLSINIPSVNLRNNRFFSISHSRTNYGRSSSINGLMLIYNANVDMIDFNISVPQLKRNLLNNFQS